MRQATPRGMSDIPPLAFPVLLADIGGTNARFAILPDTYSDVRNFPTVATASYPDPQTAIEDVVLSKTSMTPKSLVMALAGPLGGRSIRLTNADWTIDQEALRLGLNLDEVLLLNDFQALAMALPNLGESEFRAIGGGIVDPAAPRVVLGPGTGLGVAALVRGVHRFIPIAGEGGHVSFAPETDEDIALWPHLERSAGRLTWETVLSGSGLARTHNAIAIVEGKEVRAGSGEAVTAAAVAGEPVAVRTMQLFSRWLGRYAGDLALIFLARGGVFVGGGIVQRHPQLFDQAQFRAGFEEKAPHSPILKLMPTFMITVDRPAMTGLAAFARVPNRYGLSLQERRIQEHADNGEA